MTKMKKLHDAYNIVDDQLLFSYNEVKEMRKEESKWQLAIFFLLGIMVGMIIVGVMLAVRYEMR